MEASSLTLKQAVVFVEVFGRIGAFARVFVGAFREALLGASVLARVLAMKLVLFYFCLLSFKNIYYYKYNFSCFSRNITIIEDDLKMY